MDWLGAIAGIEKFLLKWLTLAFGGWLHYNAGIEIINQHYHKKVSDSQLNEGGEEQEEVRD